MAAAAATEWNTGAEAQQAVSEVPGEASDRFEAIWPHRLQGSPGRQARA